MKQNKEKNKIKIGVIGEHPNHDSQALIALLSKASLENVEFQVVMKKFRGGGLDSDRFLKVLVSEIMDLDRIIFIRDSDEAINDQIIAYKHIRDEWFRKANKVSGEKGIFFLAIAELEALILADIKTFNDFYGVTAQFSGNPMMVQDPKKKLENFSNKSRKGKYDETHAPDIFEKLEFKTVYTRHKGERSFQTFADELKQLKILEFKLS
jgi:hypothetical protein